MAASKEGKEIVRVSPRPWPFVAMPSLLLALTAVVPLTPPDERHANPVVVMAFFVVGATVAGVMMFCLWWPRRGDVLIADIDGLRITSRRRGDRTLPWSQIESLGWLLPVGGDVGLAGRLRNGNEDQPQWLCNPAGRVQPRSLTRLCSLAEEAGVRWERFTHAEVRD